jgi:hypothetical protein
MGIQPNIKSPSRLGAVESEVPYSPDPDRRVVYYDRGVFLSTESLQKGANQKSQAQ